MRFREYQPILLERRIGGYHSPDQCGRIGMVHGAKELSGIKRSLDRLEVRIKAYRKYLLEMAGGQIPVGEVEEIAITCGEVEIIEALIIPTAS